MPLGAVLVQLSGLRFHCVGTTPKGRQCFILTRPRQARLSSLDDDLNLEGYQYGTAVSILSLGCVSMILAMVPIRGYD